MTYDNAGRIIDVVNGKFNEYNIPRLEIIDNIIPADNSTLFVCSGMQNLKDKFKNPDGTNYSSGQWCIRTNDLDLVGDGTHLSSFLMLGNFSFLGISYHDSCLMWLEILRDLGIRPDFVNIHRDGGHEKIWKDVEIRYSDDCVWTDGDIGGYCCEIFKDGIEIGNLVNTSGNMVDVGFGMERLLMFLEESNPDENCIIADHLRTITLLHKNGVHPGPQGRNFITRKLIRRCLGIEPLEFFKDTLYYDWFQQEYLKKENSIKSARSSLRRHKDKSYEFWKATYGLLPEEVDMLLKCN